MADTNDTLFIARESDISTLRGHFDAAFDGDGRVVVVQAGLGGGKRALVGTVAQAIAKSDEDVLLWRGQIMEEEDGLRTVLRLYAGLYAVLHRNPLMRTKVEMILNSQMPKHTPRVQGWFQAFIEGLKKAPKPGEESFQVSLPRDNPMAGLTELVSVISARIPTFLEIQNTHGSHSVGLCALWEGLMDVCCGERSRLCLVFHTEPVDEDTKVYLPAPWMDFLERRKDDYHLLAIEPWGVEEIEAYLTGKGLEGNAAAILRVSGGKPGFVAELVDMLDEQSRLHDDLEGETLASLTPMEVDESDLEPSSDKDSEQAEQGGTAPVGKRRKATAADGPLVHHVAAMLGNVFPSTLIADMAGLERDSVDDLLDACEDLYREVQYSEPIKSWMYAFRRGIYRFGVLDSNKDEESRQRALRIAGFMERFLAPRGHEFILKTLRAYALAQEPRRAQVLKSMAITADVPDMWAMTQEYMSYFKGVEWPKPMRRTVYLNLMERLVGANAVEQAEKLFNEAIQWATDNEDRQMQAQILFAGSRLDLRRGDVYRARDRYRDSLVLFKALDNKFKVAEVYNHAAMVELQDGNPNAALEHVDKAVEVADVPMVHANAHFLRGLVDKRERKWQDAIAHFRKANEAAGTVGMGPLALEAGVHLGECLLQAREAAKAADILTRCVQIAQALRNPARERASSALLAQAQGAQKLYQAALGSAQHTLDLTRRLKAERLLAADTFNVAFFTLQLGNANEAVSLLRQAVEKANPAEQALYKEIHFHLGMALQRVGELLSAKPAFETTLEIAKQLKDNRRVMDCNAALADIAMASGQSAEARGHLKAALAIAEAGNLRQERKVLKRKLDSLK